MSEREDIVERLRSKSTDCHEVDAALYLEAAKEIEFLRKQSRGHFETMTVVLRDGIEAIMPDAKPKRSN